MELYTDGNLDGLRQQTDQLADEAVRILMSNTELIDMINAWEKIPDLLPENFPKVLHKLISIYREIPPMVNPGKVKLAQDFFEKNGSLYLALLGFYSLPICYAYEDGARVLIKSKRIMEEPGIRLAETALFVLDAFRPGNFLQESNLLSLLKVRLIHAFSRYFIQKYVRDWVPGWGQPINQEDLLGTNLAFSLIITRGFRKLNKTVTLDQADAVLHYWKIIGHYLGLNVDFWPENPKEAFALEKMIRKRHLRPSAHGKVLMASLLNYYRASVVNPALAGIAEDLVCYFVGMEGSKALGIHKNISLPTGLYGLMLQFGLFNQQGKMSTYSALRRQFTINAENQFGQVVSLNLPIQKRS